MAAGSFSVWVKSPSTQAEVCLGPIEASNDTEAAIWAGKLINTKMDELEQDGIVSILRPDGTQIDGLPVTVAEFDKRG